MAAEEEASAAPKTPIAAANTPPNRREDGADVEGGLHAAEWTSATTSDSI